ncbi:MAG: ROK family protein [Myxococcota bacterium]
MFTFSDVPRIVSPLDPGFRPISLARRAFREEIARARTSAWLTFALERDQGQVSIVREAVFADAHPLASHNAAYAERLLKSLLWQRGAGRVLVSGPSSAVAELAETYSPSGARAFDAAFFGNVYERTFSVEPTREDQLPRARERARPLGGDFRGCRIGFDAGGSDCKVAALADGEVVYADEFAWEPKAHDDPRYHLAMVHDCIRTARTKLAGLDAIGVSSAGIYVNNQTRVASLFRRVPKAAFDEHIRNIYADLEQQWGVPVEVANDGDVAALAGSLELGSGSLLGLAFGTSLAAGFVDEERRILGWLNELAFAPLDLAEAAPRDEEWSGDCGTGVQYLSQDAALRLAASANLELKAGTKAERLRELQLRAEDNERAAISVFETMGVYLGYALLDYAEFYPMRNVLLLGRVTSGVAGGELLKAAQHVLSAEAPALLERVTLHLPAEAQRRVGQATAAASLPVLTGRAGLA